MQEMDKEFRDLTDGAMQRLIKSHSVYHDLDALHDGNTTLTFKGSLYVEDMKKLYFLPHSTKASILHRAPQDLPLSIRMYTIENKEDNRQRFVGMFMDKEEMFLYGEVNLSKRNYYRMLTNEEFELYI